MVCAMGRVIGKRAIALGAIALTGLSAAALAPAASARDLLTGFAAPEYGAGNSAVRQHWLTETVNENAEIARISISWAQVAQGEPVNPTDPNDPAYDWTTVDGAVGDAAATPGIVPVLTVTKAPNWAEGDGRPSDLDPSSSWKPSATAFGEFGQALATRYAGQLTYYQAWNEPNLEKFLAPQWKGKKARSPKTYRHLLNAFYDGVHTADPDAQVLAGGTAPYGDPPGGSRMRPITFLSKLFCLKGKRLHAINCPDPVNFEVLGQNAINGGAPTKHAASRLDVSTNDLGRVQRLLRKARRAGTIQPAGKKPLWVTEFWWETDPPDPTGVRLKKQAKWIEQALYLFWKQHARAAIQFEIRDADCAPAGCSARPNNFQTGVFFFDSDPLVSDPKPSAKAFQFPFVTNRTGRSHVSAWGKSPATGSLEIQKHKRSGWHTIATVPAEAGSVFTDSLRLRGAAKLRATVGGFTSLAWKQGD
jgi:hypothetical protein